jgi:hypothetical protein
VILWVFAVGGVWLLILGFGLLLCVVAAAADRQTDAHIARRQTVEAAVAARQVDVSDDQRRGSARTE